MYGLEWHNLNASDLKSLDFTVTRVLMKLFRTSNKEFPRALYLGLFYLSPIAPVGQIAAHHGLCHQQYADDTQLYIALSKTNGPVSISQIEACLSHLQYWLCLNGLCLNPDKTEAIILGNYQQLRTFPVPDKVDVAGCPVAISNKITTLGVTLDQNLTFRAHISVQVILLS